MALQPSYTSSRALVIGIDTYRHASPLSYAVADAEALAKLLAERFAFPTENVILLTEQEASRERIVRTLLSFANAPDPENERIVVFFAGHGYTARSRRGEVGFLVPCEGDPRDLASLVRWDELTRCSDLLPAKHVLFLMDACYGGLAITRSLQPGAMRFLKDMLLRYARQVITAGKADEVVADLGGPLPGHSVFTGHLLQALRGGAADPEGVLTANGVMAYVYRHVGHDPSSRQTPHFGYIDGDGDLIFAAPFLGDNSESDPRWQDTLFAVPSPAIQAEPEAPMSLVETTKQFLSDPRFRIQLHDLVATRTRELLAATHEDAFPLGDQWASTAFAERLKRYEQASWDLMSILALVGYWGTTRESSLLSLPTRRLASRLEPTSGFQIWISLRWYPAMLLTYASGLASVANSNYASLYRLLHTPLPDPRRPGASTLAIAMMHGFEETDAGFKSLPGHERHFVPRSEYILKLLQPLMDDLLFLGTEYETIFDRFEMLLALDYADQREKTRPGTFWGPVGRFAWKQRSLEAAGPLSAMRAEAQAAGGIRGLLEAGFFDGSLERFVTVADGMLNLVNRLPWH